MEFKGCQALITILALIVGGLFSRLVKKWRRRDSESASRTENSWEEEIEALRKDLETPSRLDNMSGEEYEVFLCFRGPDTRNGFTDCLYHGLKGAGIRVFLDSEELEDGDNINMVLKAVNESQIYIPVFSPNFASSPWCLREVERMVECTSNLDGKKKIIPIFYDVKADDVKLRTDLYRKAIRKHEKMKKYSSDELKRWESALKKVGGILGRELNGKR